MTTIHINTSQYRRIEHSGHAWWSYGVSESGRPIWPIQEFLARRPDFTQSEIKEFKKLYPDGKEEGALPFVPRSVSERARRLSI